MAVSTKPGLQAGSLPSFSSRSAPLRRIRCDHGNALPGVPLGQRRRPFPATGTYSERTRMAVRAFLNLTQDTACNLIDCCPALASQSAVSRLTYCHNKKNQLERTNCVNIVSKSGKMWGKMGFRCSAAPQKLPLIPKGGWPSRVDTGRVSPAAPTDIWSRPLIGNACSYTRCLIGRNSNANSWQYRILTPLPGDCSES